MPFSLKINSRLVMPKISVILPVYNGEFYLKESIQSVINQTYKDFELIIIDDCSTDNSSVIAKQYAESDPKIIYLKNETNLKLPESLNKGFSRASGAYWTWTSCDNIYLPHALEKLSWELDTYSEVGLVYSDMEIIDELGAINDCVLAGCAEDIIFRNVVGACFLYRASIARKIGGYNKELFLCEDYEYWVRMALKAKLRPVKDCLYRYRKHSKSLSNTREKEVIARGISVQKKYYPFFIKTRHQAALFYTSLRARDIYNPFRQLYLLMVFFYSPIIFFKELKGLVMRRFQ